MTFTSHLLNEETRFWFIEGREGVLNEHFITLNCTEDSVNYKDYG